MSDKKGNAVIAGDVIFAGIDEDDRSEIKNAIVIEFEDLDSFRAALHSGKVEFSLFGRDPSGA